MVSKTRRAIAILLWTASTSWQIADASLRTLLYATQQQERIVIANTMPRRSLADDDISKVFQPEQQNLSMTASGNAGSGETDTNNPDQLPVAEEAKPEYREDGDYPKYPDAQKRKYENEEAVKETRLTMPPQDPLVYVPVVTEDKAEEKADQGSYSVYGHNGAKRGGADTAGQKAFDSDSSMKKDYDLSQHHVHDFSSIRSFASGGDAADVATTTLAEPTAAERAGNGQDDLDQTAKFVTQTHQPVTIAIPHIQRYVYSGVVKLKAHGPQHLQSHAQTIFDTMKPILTDYWTVQIGSTLKAYDLRLVYASEDVLNDDEASQGELARIDSDFEVSVILEVNSNSMASLAFPNHESVTEDLALFFRGQTLFEFLSNLRSASVYVNELVYQGEDFQAPEITSSPSQSPTDEGPVVSEINSGNDPVNKGPINANSSSQNDGKNRVGMFAGIGAGLLLLGAFGLAFKQNNSRKSRLFREKLNSSFSDSDDSSSGSSPPSEIDTSNAFEIKDGKFSLEDPRVVATYQKYPSLGIRPAALQKKPAFSKDYLSSGLETPSIDHQAGGGGTSVGSKSSATHSDVATLSTNAPSVRVEGDFNVPDEYDVVTKSPVSDYSSFRQLRDAEEDEFSMPDDYGSVSTNLMDSRGLSRPSNNTKFGKTGRSLLLESGLITPSSAGSSPTSPFGIEHGTDPTTPPPSHVRRTQNYDESVSYSPRTTGENVSTPSRSERSRPHGVPMTQSMLSPHTLYSQSNTVASYSVKMMDGPDMLATSTASGIWGDGMNSVDEEDDEFMDEWSVASFKTLSPLTVGQKHSPQRKMNRNRGKKQKDQSHQDSLDLNMPPLV